MRIGATHHVKRLPSGEPDVDQGLVHGFQCTYNPDDGKFYLHEPGTEDGAGVWATRTDWRNIVQVARQRAAATERE